MAGARGQRPRGLALHRERVWKTAGSSAITSRASMEHSPMRPLRESAANPWMYTPQRAASLGERPWARNALIIPAKTSPLPPLARPAFPVVF